MDLVAVRFVSMYQAAEKPGHLRGFVLSAFLWSRSVSWFLAIMSRETVTGTVIVNAVGEVVERSEETAGGLASGLAVATALMIVFRQRYPRWWFDFSRELVRFGGRVGAYLLLLTDRQ